MGRPVFGASDRLDGWSRTTPVLLETFGGDRVLLGGVLEGTFFFLLLDVFRVTVKVQINHNIPLDFPSDVATETEDFTGEEPPHETDRVDGRVVARNGNVDVPKWRVSVAQGNARDVDVRRFTHRLVVLSRVRHNQEPWLVEGLLDLVGEGTWGVPSSEWLGANVVGELEHGPGAERSARDGAHVLWVLDGGDNPRGKHHLLPRLVEVDDVGTVLTSFVHVLLHVVVGVLGTDVARSHEKFGDVLFFFGGGRNGAGKGQREEIYNVSEKGREI